MDNPKNMNILAEIGTKAANKYILNEHFVDFITANPPSTGETYFVSYKDYGLPFEAYAKKIHLLALSELTMILKS